MFKHLNFLTRFENLYPSGLWQNLGEIIFVKKSRYAAGVAGSATRKGRLKSGQKRFPLSGTLADEELQLAIVVQNPDPNYDPVALTVEDRIWQIIVARL